MNSFCGCFGRMTVADSRPNMDITISGSPSCRTNSNSSDFPHSMNLLSQLLISRTLYMEEQKSYIQNIVFITRRCVKCKNKSSVKFYKMNEREREFRKDN